MGNHPSKNSPEFIIACCNGDVHTVETLLPTVDVNVRDDVGKTGFIKACFWNPEIVSLLQKDPRIDVNAADYGGFTGFMMACASRQPQILELLLNDPRVDVNKVTSTEHTGFMLACFMQDPSILNLLLNSSRVNFNYATSEGITAFNSACFSGNYLALSMLLDNIRVDCVKGWKTFMNHHCILLCREGKTQTQSAAINRESESDLYSLWLSLANIVIVLFGDAEYDYQRMKTVWLKGTSTTRTTLTEADRQRRCKSYRDICDIVLEQDVICLLSENLFAPVPIAAKSPPARKNTPQFEAVLL